MNIKNNKLAQIGLAIVLILGAAVGWYLISPLFINVSVDEEFPVLQESLTTATIEIAEDIEKEEATQASPVEESLLTEEPLPTENPQPTADPDGLVILAGGEFYDLAHHGMGTATVYQLEDGSRVLRLENFEVLNGPELHVYLTSANPVANTVGVPLENEVDLGALKGNIGNQNYELPIRVNLDLYHSVVIWCVPFQVPFNAAPLITP